MPDPTSADPGPEVVYLQRDAGLQEWQRYPDGEVVVMIPKAELDALRGAQITSDDQRAEDYTRGARETLEAVSPQLAEHQREISQLRARLVQTEAAAERLRTAIEDALQIAVMEDRDLLMEPWASLARALPEAPPVAARQEPVCPQCGGKLNPVKQTAMWMNRDQWESQRAGDWYCQVCPPNDRGERNKWCYWWQRELSAPPVAAGSGE